ncbi:MAG: aminopeptidase P family protein [Hyphomonadaceae bacterium]|nr:aminopeptidase P family protein [Hyphomonadaceae bacterium]
MKQNFDVKGGPQIGRDNLPKLRQVMAAQGLDGFYVPHEDEYQNEYLPDANERLAWVSGFTGSFGSAMILTDRAALFIDGRYTIQAADQTDPALFDRVAVPDPGPFGWLAAQDLADQSIGYDPALMTPNDVAQFAEAAQKAGANIVAVSENPIDQAWRDRPAQPLQPILPHDLKFAGQAADEKRAEIAAQLRADSADAVVITSPASIAWLFNIRGGDVACSPLPLARAILRSDGSATLLMDPAKESEGLRQHLGNQVTIADLTQLEPELAGLKGQTVSLDPALASAWFFQTLEAAGARILRQQDPVLLPKACKNAAELSGTAAAHRRDGAAVTKFLHWLDTEAQSGSFTEIDAALKLLDFRAVDTSMQDMSFETISGAGPNGALPHYRVSSASNLTLSPGTLYLVDSGGQYPDGTTDITRTVVIGPPSQDMKRHYTLVLKGHIALDRVRFPEGTTGTHLDTLARHALWQAGLDYDHGTGHGVGVYLGVHEGPQRIAKAWNATPLMPGMIVSNEPGYYREGAYGIRIENLQYVTPAEDIDGGDRPMLGFECLTFAPLARDLIEPGLLSPEERDWVDDYHQRVLSEIGPLVDGDVADWLARACLPL